MVTNIGIFIYQYCIVNIIWKNKPTFG